MEPEVSELGDKHVLIVGGASGIGKAVAEQAARLGARISIAGRNRDRLDSTLSEYSEFAAIQLDAGDASSIENGMADIDVIDHLVLTVSSSAAGLGVTVAMADMPLDQARAFLAGKFWAQYQCAKLALPKLSTNASITFTSGVAVRRSLPGHTVVAANNAAIEASAKQLAKEIAPVRVNVVSPGLTQTRAYDHLSDNAKSEFFERVTAGQPIARPGTPKEIAQAYLFAMTSTFLTGAVIDIDGGFLVQ